MKRSARSAGIAVCLALIAGSAVAAVTRVSFDFFFPGVDVDGNLDDGLGAEGIVRATYNSRTDRLRIVGHAVVENESNRRQVYEDTGVLDGFDGDVVRDRYVVQKGGSARYNGLLKDSSGFPE